jgi:hypothetical protein
MEREGEMETEMKTEREREREREMEMERETDCEFVMCVTDTAPNKYDPLLLDFLCVVFDTPNCWVEKCVCVLIRDWVGLSTFCCSYMAVASTFACLHPTTTPDDDTHKRLV